MTQTIISPESLLKTFPFVHAFGNVCPLVFILFIHTVLFMSLHHILPLFYKSYLLLSFTFIATSGFIFPLLSLLLPSLLSSSVPNEIT